MLGDGYLNFNRLIYHSFGFSILASQRFPRKVSVTNFFLTAPEPKKLTASPDGVITSEALLKEFISSVEAKDEAKKDLNDSTNVMSQVPDHCL